MRGFPRVGTDREKAMLSGRTGPNRPHVDVMHDGLGTAIHAEVAALGQDFGGAIIIEADETVVLQAGYGWANCERAIPFTTGTIAQIGSLTKQFTATAIVALAEDGRLAYDDPLAKHLPGVAAAAADLTLHQLLTHTAGLPECGGDDFDRVSRNDLITNKLARLDDIPGRQYAYSNLGYSALAAVVEVVTGQSLERYLAERFIAPLGMTRTGTIFAPVQQDLLAWGYTGNTLHAPLSDRIAALAPDFWNLKGNGGMQASAQDMQKWYHALANGPIITEPMRLVLLAPHAYYDQGIAYGYGWFVHRDSDAHLVQVSHAGSDGIFYTALIWRPRDRVFCYLVTNTGSAMGAPLAGRIRSMMAAGS